MTPERWQQIESVLQEALDRPPLERAPYLEEIGRVDPELCSEATSLIDAYEQAGDFIEEPAVSTDADVLLKDLPDSNLGRKIGQYHLVQRIGSGGMGEVYLAEDARLSRRVAVKLLPSSFDQERLRRFRSEAQTISALNHPNIITIHEVGEADGTHFIATEFIDGETVRQLIGTGLSLAEILDISIQVGAGLAAAHAAQIVHRDIKPENLMRRRDNLVKILDFGVAKALRPVTTNGSNIQETQDGVVLGTVGYMSPEQARGMPVDARTDVWSLGAVIYEMITRRQPFAAPTQLDSLVQILEREAPKVFPEIENAPPELLKLQRVVECSLSKDREARYASMDEMLAELRALRQEIELTGLLEEQNALLTKTRAGNNVNVLHTQARFAWPQVVLLLIVVFAALTFGLVYFGGSSKSDSNANVVSFAGKQYRNMNEAERLAFIAEQEQRISAMMGERPAKLNNEALAAIKDVIDHRIARDADPSTPPAARLDATYQRAVPYIPLIARSFAERKVPLVVGIYLPMLESAFKPCIESPLGAKGLYQFMPQTARRYGVAPEEMCDAEKMTPAAAHYIADRMAELGEDSQSMTLVILSFTTGEGWLLNTLRELRNSPNYERTFWTLFAQRDQLDENFRRSAGYVPGFFAAAIIGENPQVFGLTTPALSTLA